MLLLYMDTNMTNNFAQMVTIDKDTSLFLFGYNKKNELVFRSSRVPEQLQNEKIKKRLNKEN